MTELKNYLSEKNISLKDFAKITKVKEKKLTGILDNQEFFSDDEATRVSSFLGVSKNELYHGVIERKGELPEVAEQNNLNHFRYFIKNRLKNAKRFLDVLSAIAGISVTGLAFIYVVLMFAQITGLPTILRSFDVMLLCFIVPVFGLFMLVDIARYKILEKKTTMFSKINIEAIGISILLLVFSISCFANDFIPVEALILTAIGSVALSVTSFISLFKNKPFKNSGLQFFVCMIPTAFLIAAEVIVSNYFVDMAPEDGSVGEALETATILFFFVFALLIFGVFYFSLVQFFNGFVKGVGRFFEPAKKTASISKGKLATYIIGAVVLATITFLGILVSQGVYLKYMYINMFEGQEESVNWTSELITDYDTQFKKGEYDVIKFEGMKIKIPESYEFNKDSDYASVYKKDEDSIIMLQKPMYEYSHDFDIFDEDFGDGKLTEEQLEGIKEDFIKSFGFYPKTFYEWQKLNGMVTLDDIDIFNPRKTAILSTVLIMKATAVVPNSEYYLYENGDLYATIIISTIENEEKGNREMVSISFGSTDLKYGVTMARPDQDNDKTIEEVTKILNSVKMN